MFTCICLNIFDDSPDTIRALILPCARIFLEQHVISKLFNRCLFLVVFSLLSQVMGLFLFPSICFLASFPPNVFPMCLTRFCCVLLPKAFRYLGTHSGGFLVDFLCFGDVSCGMSCGILQRILLAFLLFSCGVHDFLWISGAIRGLDAFAISCGLLLDVCQIA